MPFGDDGSINAVVSTSGRAVNLSVSATGLTGLTVYRLVNTVQYTVRNAQDAAPTGVDLWTGADYEPPQGEVLEYYADITDGVTTVTIGPASTSPDVVNYGGDWIMPVGAPGLGFNVTVEAGGAGPFTRAIQQDVQRVLNRSAPVVVSFGREGLSGPLTLLTLNDAEADSMRLLLEYPVIVFASRPGYGLENPVYFSVGDVIEERPSPLGAEQARRWTLPLTQVDQPPADYPGILIGVSWATRQGASNTWQNAKDNYVDWYDYAGYP